MRNLLLAVAASSLMFACSSEKETGTIPEQGVVFELATVNEPQHTITTRARPLYSQDAVQEIENVQIMVFKKDGDTYTYSKTYTIPSWSRGTSFQRFTVPDDNKLATGDYQFLAIGQEANNNYTFTNPTIGSTLITDITATITAPGKESEFFAGSKDVTVSSEGVRVNIDMTRKIAGVLGYFKNVPTQIGNTTVKYLRVSVSSTDNSVLVYNGAGTGNVSNTTYNIIDVDLTGQASANGVYTGNDLAAQGVVKVPNSQLYGQFILPVNSITMKVGLYGDSATPLKEWAVQDNGSTTFNLTANHFYALGQKVSKNDTTGGGTPDTGDDDAPIDLLKDQVIAITINANWNDVHNLFIQ